MANDRTLIPGSRIRLTPLGVARCPKLGGRVTGVIVNATPTRSGFLVLIDGTKTVRNFHRSYIMSIEIEEFEETSDALA
jgi:hypothetical protein